MRTNTPRTPHDDKAADALALALVLTVQGVFWLVVGLTVGHMLWGQ